ncbi:MAG: peptidase, partial [Bauldia sp.]|nr:peptidase [Bauldia sp.]
MRITKSTASRLVAAPLVLSGLWIGSAQAAEVEDVLVNYADIALAGYEDSLTTAKALDAAIDDLI